MSSDQFRILIVDDEPNIRSGLQKGLAAEAYQIETAADADEALDKFRARPFHLVIADVRLPSVMNGLELVERILRSHPETSAIVVTAHGTVETAVAAMRLGAIDFITKPMDLELIREQVRKARYYHDLRVENHELRERLASAGEISGIIGNCASMQEVFRLVRQVAPTNATVFIRGESGTGKELVASALHQLSDRSEMPLVSMNLGALPETLLESELFGHEQGAFTGASRRKPGCFERAQGGTLFLDEILEIPPKCQVDLLRVLETGQYSRIGGEALLECDVRLISATNKDPHTEIEKGTFREDLYYRLNIVPIEIPPLRERREDIPLLVDHFLTHFCKIHHREMKTLADDAMEILTAAPWPGNIRQLRNVMERIVVTVTHDVIHAEDIPPEIRAVVAPANGRRPQKLVDVVELAEKTAIVEALHACSHHREQTAQALGISVRTLHYKMNRYGLH